MTVGVLHIVKSLFFYYYCVEVGCMGGIASLPGSPSMHADIYIFIRLSFDNIRW